MRDGAQVSQSAHSVIYHAQIKEKKEILLPAAAVLVLPSEAARKLLI